MSTKTVLQNLKPWILPIAMVGGLVMHRFIEAVAFIAPWLIFVMLLITYCRVDVRHFRLTRLTWLLLAVQIPGSLLVYLACLPLGQEVAEGAFICVFCPTATAAPVITGMLGGSVERLATFSIVSNAVVALLAPILFAAMGHAADGPGIVEGFAAIGLKVVPLILGPLVLALLLRRVAPSVHRGIAGHQSLSFYIWACSLFIVVGRAVAFVMKEPAAMIPKMLLIAGLSLLMCVAQFAIGRRAGAACGDKIVGAQGLGQKNTVLAIWMALTWLHPLSSIGPAAYVAWQNTINSLQLYLHERRKNSTSKN